MPQAASPPPKRIRAYKPATAPSPTNNPPSNGIDELRCAQFGQCEHNPLCTRGYKHQGKGGWCNAPRGPAPSTAGPSTCPAPKRQREGADAAHVDASEGRRGGRRDVPCKRFEAGPAPSCRSLAAVARRLGTHPRCAPSDMLPSDWRRVRAADGAGEDNEASVTVSPWRGQPVAYAYEQLRECGRLLAGSRLRGGLGLRLLYTLDRRLPRELLRQYAHVVADVLPNMPQERLLHDDQAVGNYHLLLSQGDSGRIVAGITFRVIRACAESDGDDKLLFDNIVFDALLAVVALDAQGRGYGSLLVERLKRIAEKQATALGVGALLLTQARAT